MEYSLSRTKNCFHCFQKRAVRLVYDDYELTFEELLEKDGSFTIHHYNIQAWYIELYKVHHNFYKLFSVSCLHETIVPITCGLNLILSFLKWI